jgi:hypothetical protein
VENCRRERRYALLDQLSDKFMKRSQAIAIGIVQAVAAAALAAGCGSRATTTQTERDWENCVDRNGQVVNDQQCRQEQPRYGTSGYVPYYHWYYTRGYRPLGIGIPATGGTVTRPSSLGGLGAGSHPASSPSVTRGGFGSIGSGHAVGS